MLMLVTRSSCTLDWVAGSRKLPTLSHLTASEVGRTLSFLHQTKRRAGGRRIRGGASCERMGIPEDQSEPTVS